jgi:probable rRNA maturation factor
MIDIVVDDPDWRRALPAIEQCVRRAAGLAAAQGVQGEQGPLGEIVILLTDDAAVRDLNARFRGKEIETNVLSFPAPAFHAGLLGDLALAFGVCWREAETQGKTFESHVSHLVIHGVLHLMGFDHLGEAEAEEMESLERRLLAHLGIADPYASGVETESHEHRA